MLYHYFGDKQGLYLAVLENTYSAIRTAEIGLNLTALDPLAGMRKLVLFTWQYFIDHPEFLSLLATENMNRAAYLKKSKAIRPAAWFAGRCHRRAAQARRRAKLFRAGVDPVDLYISIAGLGFFYMSNRHTLSTIFDQDLSAPERLAARGDHIVDVVLGYLRPVEKLEFLEVLTARPDSWWKVTVWLLTARRKSCVGKDNKGGSRGNPQTRHCDVRHHRTHGA